MTLGERIRKERYRQQLTQDQLSKRMTAGGYTITKSMVSRHEGGHRTISRAALYAYATALNSAPEFLDA